MKESFHGCMLQENKMEILIAKILQCDQKNHWPGAYFPLQLLSVSPAAWEKALLLMNWDPVFKNICLKPAKLVVSGWTVTRVIGLSCPPMFGTNLYKMKQILTQLYDSRNNKEEEISLKKMKLPLLEQLCTPHPSCEIRSLLPLKLPIYTSIYVSTFTYCCSLITWKNRKMAYYIQFFCKARHISHI